MTNMDKIAGLPIVLDDRLPKGEAVLVGVIKEPGKEPRLTAVKVTGIDKSL